jgi:glutathione S-transferase
MLALYAHPFSSYCWKALIALWEKEISFDYRQLTPEAPENWPRMLELWPIGKFPVLVDGDRVLGEATVIIEYLDRLAPEPSMIGSDPIEARLMDRIFDNHVMNVMQVVVNEHLFRPDALREGDIADAEARLDKIYAWLDERLAGREWAAGDAFGLADCAGAPSLFYADWVRPIPDRLHHLKSYRARVLARPSVARAVEEARPYRPLFPPGAPDRD